MATPEHPRTSHALYIGAVRRRLEDRGLDAAPPALTPPGGRRQARLLLHPREEAFPDPVPGNALLDWDEENGWSLTPAPDASGPVEPGPVFKGLGAVPDPDDVAAWVVVLLTHPHLTPSREDHPYRDHTADDPDFESQLARYTPGQ